MRKPISICFIIPFFINCGFAQRKSTVDICYSAYEEFSFRSDIAKTLNPQFTQIGREHLVVKGLVKYYYPWIRGVRYTRTTQKSIWFIGIDATDSYPGKNHRAGETFNISFLMPFGGYGKRIYESAKGNLICNSYLATKFRHGNDTYWLNYVGWVDILPYRKLRDIGLSVGANVVWYLPWNFVASAEVGLTKWLFLYSNVFDRDLVGAYYPLKPGNQFDMRIGLGYTFSDRKKPVVGSSRWTGKNTLGFSAAIPFFFDSPDRAVGVHLKESFRSPLAGLHYQRQLKGRASILAGAYYHRVSYNDRGSFRTMARPGNVHYREFFLAKSGLSYRILSWKPLSINVPLSIAYRNGREEYRVSNILPERGWGRRITDGTHQMNDIGLATGLNVGLQFLKTLQAGFNIDYCYFVFRKDNGKRTTNTGIGTSPHILAVGLSLGYRFGWKPKSSEAGD